MISRTALAVATGILCCAGALAQSQDAVDSVAVESESAPDVTIPVNNLTSDDRSLRLQLPSDVEGARHRVISESLDVLRNSIGSGELEGPVEAADPRVVAIKVLGALRATESTKHLIKMMELEEDRIFTFRIDSSEMANYPAVVSLAQIGAPAADDCLFTLGRGDNSPTRIKKLCWVVGKVYGRDLGLSAMKLKVDELRRDRDNATREQVIARESAARAILAAIEVYEEIFPAQTTKR